MPPAISAIASWIASIKHAGWGAVATMILLAGLNVAAFDLLRATEDDYVGHFFFFGMWVLLNGFWLILTRRPAISAVLSLVPVVVLIALSRFKSENLWMTVSFVDIMVIDFDTVSFLFEQAPNLRNRLTIGAMAAVPILAAIWWLDPYRVRRRISATVFAGSLAGLVGLAVIVPEEPWEAFVNSSYISKFVRSGVTAARELMTRGVFEAEARALPADPLPEPGRDSCQPSGRPPHIIMVLDESSFDIRAAPGIKVPDGYGDHFRSFDGKQRSLLVEGSGGPTWYTEYNVLSGLSSRSFGRFAYFLTRIAAGNVQRGLPRALRHCGYKTITHYPAFGAFLSARQFQSALGVELFRDSAELGIDSPRARDKEYYDEAIRTIARERGPRPLFLFVYLTANHFWWDFPYRPELTPEWRAPGNDADTDEYIRRQTMSAGDYTEFVARLRGSFPDESFLIVRFGDHQPAIAPKLVSPGADDATIGRQVMANDPRYLTTYYAIDAIKFRPADLSSALDVLDAPYLPLVVLEAAGLPLDSTFAEQKRILRRCNGLFYACRDGAEVRRFNRLLIDAGLIKGL